MVPPPVTIVNITVGALTNAISLCNALIDRYDVKKDVKDSCTSLRDQLSSCQKKANELNTYISRHRVTEVWKPMVSEINNALNSIESRLFDLLMGGEVRSNIFALPRRKFRQPYDMDKKLSALVREVQQIDMKIFIFQTTNNQLSEANETSSPQTSGNSVRQVRESDFDNDSGHELVPDVPATQVDASTPDSFRQHISTTETTTAFSLVSDLAKGCKDLVVYSGRALIVLGGGALLRMQEALVANAVADCSECLGLLGNKKWYFCGSDVLPVFVVKMALIAQPELARRKIVDKLMSLSNFGAPDVAVGARLKENWVATTTMDVSFVNALMIKDHFRSRNGARAEGMAGNLNQINSELIISASDMQLVLRALRQRFFENQGLVIVSNGEQGLGWYRVLSLCGDGLERKRRVSTDRLEYICSLEYTRGGGYSSVDMKDMMILNFLHVTEISPEARKLKENTGRKWSYMTTALSNEANMYEGDQAIFDGINFEGKVYTELLEIACLHNLRAGFYTRCQSFVDSLVDTVDERRLVISTMTPVGANRHTRLRQGKEISFSLHATKFYASVLEDAEDRKVLAGCNDLYEYGRFCAEQEVMVSWYDLLVPSVINSVDVNFAQAALTGRGSYTKFAARNMSVCLKDSILLCDPASDSIAVAFDAASEMSSSLNVSISALVSTTESERLRAAFFICRGAVRARKDTSTRMLDVMRSRYMGLQGIESISVQDVVEDLDEGDRRNPAIIVECMESMAMQGGYRKDALEKSLFAAMCSFRECEKTMIVRGIWPPLFGMFTVHCCDDTTWVELDPLGSEVRICASKHGTAYRAEKIGRAPSTTSRELERYVDFICVQ